LDLPINCLIGADGPNSVCGNIISEYKVFKGAEAIGITANLKNYHTSDEAYLKEFGLMSTYNRPFFLSIKEKLGLDLENLVYYREETHYLVMTIKRESLLKRGVVNEDYPEIEKLIASDNINQENLEKLIKELCNFLEIPQQCDFVQEGGKSDVCLFDFSKKRSIAEPSKILSNSVNSKKLLVSLVGDSLVEPFWPKGHGANRAILSALDTAHQIKQFIKYGEENVVEERKAVNTLSTTSEPENLIENFEKWNLSPSSRYKGCKPSAHHSQQASS